MEQITISKIEKEQLPGFSFQEGEVLIDEDLIKRRWRELNRGMTLGNLHKAKTKIIFESKEAELFQVDTSIWSITPLYVILKGGVLIPIKSIHEVIV